MELTKEEALKLHREMWKDMQRKLGDNPSHYERDEFKQRWVDERFPVGSVRHFCFLCEYAIGVTRGFNDVCRAVCSNCPIKWSSDPGNNSCEDWAESETNIQYCDWRYSPISEILKLRVRN